MYRYYGEKRLVCIHKKMKAFVVLLLLCVESTQAQYCGIPQLPLEKYEQDFDARFISTPLDRNIPSPPELNQGDCGVSKNDQSKQIVKGQDAPANAWPWQIKLIGSSHMCGGSIINREWVVTAKHCAKQNVASIYYGNISFKKSKMIRAVKYFTYPSSDIAVYKLSSPLNFSDSVQPICLPEDNVWDTTPCFATGWGITSMEKYIIPDTLQQIRSRIINQTVCQAAQTFKGYLRNRGFYYCVQSVEFPTGEYAGTFSGDSGGPLSCLKNGRYYLVGVVSHRTRSEGSFISFQAAVPRAVPTIIAGMKENA
ncbi:chymotrypsinogen A-like isoform X1 [Physella acuta]|uniref:chymotrypsinogen A-like isoform X1 n=1 Tax=Physella acuta TaxID=109671 RepID=UPI0027DE9C96|nr:chymotrypsinogen A-like isoform X1 [Physella acuta]XP_059141498.1 chymotrypsinogen A-like isoform X1 [Physella acuta]XP_059141506.1 chymotrypsinogen A-like isoform X1 [Physella acuta]